MQFVIIAFIKQGHKIKDIDSTGDYRRRCLENYEE